jgi:RNase P subunit RPR2
VPSTQDFGTHYFTSNEYVRENFDQFDHYIVAEFFHKQDAYAFESQLISETRSEHQINDYKHQKMIGKKYKTKVPYVYEARYCALPECGKLLSPGIHRKCCCASHQGRYSALRMHGKI